MAFRECCHVMSDGMKCKSPALKRQSYCYFHHRYNQRQRRRIQLGGPVGTNQNTGIEMPLVESWETIQIGIQEVVEAIVDDRISTKRAGLMLYALQLASTNLKMMNIPGISQPTGVTELPEETDTPDRVPDGAPHLPQSADVGTTNPSVTLCLGGGPTTTAPDPSTALDASTAPDPCHPERSVDPPREVEGPFVSSTDSPTLNSITALNPPSPQLLESSPARQCGEPEGAKIPSRALARRQNDPLEILRQLYPGHCDETLVRFLPRTNDEDTRLYFKPDDSYARRQIINERRILLGIPL